MTNPWEESWMLTGVHGDSVGGFGDASGVPHRWVGGIVKSGDSASESSRDPECIARMHLAAAAPGLYRALAECLEVFENVVDMQAGNPRGAGRVGECARMAEAALRKARGE